MKFCAKCGAALEAEDKFCTNCGTQVVEAAPTEVFEPTTAEPVKEARIEESVKSEQPVHETVTPKSTMNSEKLNQNVEQTKKYAQSYWNWLKSSIQNPSKSPSDAHQYYGITTFALFSIIGALFIIIPGRQAFTSINQQSGNSTYDIMQNPFGIGLFLKIFVVFLIIYALYLAVGYFTLKIAGDDSDGLSLTRYTNDFAHRINFTFIFAVSALLITIIFVPNEIANSIGTDMKSFGTLNLVGLLLGVAGVSFNIGFLATILNTNVKLKFDKIYVALIAQMIILVIVYMLIRYMVVPSVQSYVMNVIDSAFSGIFGS